MAGKTLLKGGCVLTLGTKTPNFETADVAFEDGIITEVGPGLRIRGAETVEATNTIIMPGFVDAHRHTWNALFRNLDAGGVSSTPGQDLGNHLGPDDLYAATVIGLLGAIETGTTTVVDWCELAVDATMLDAVLSAYSDVGLRTVCLPGTDPTEGADARTTYASASPDLGTGDRDQIAASWSRAREDGRRIHAHANHPESSRAIADLGERGLLGPDVSLVHCSRLDEAAFGILASTGTRVILTPSSEMAIDGRRPPVQQLIDHAIRPGLGVDNERTSPGDILAQMRSVISLQHANLFDLKLAGKAGVPHLLNTREVIRYGTVDGAEAAGLGGVTGRLEPGMAADIVILRTDRPNIHPVNDPIGAVVWGMDGSNVDWVFAAGKPLMQAGHLVADVASAVAKANDARNRVADAAGLVGIGQPA